MSDGVVDGGDGGVDILVRKVDDGEGGVAPGRRSAVQHRHPGSLVHASRLHGAEDGIGAVGKDQDLPRRHPVEGIQEVPGRGRLLREDHGVGSHFRKHPLEPLVGCHRYHRQDSILLGGGTEDLLGPPRVLDRHILHLHSQELTEAVTVSHNRLGRRGVDVHLDLVPLQRSDHRLAQGVEVSQKTVVIKLSRGGGQLEQKLGAVAQGKVAVAVKEGVVHEVGGPLGRSLGGRGQRLPPQVAKDALQEVDEARAAAVHHTRLFEDGQKLGGALQGLLGRGGHQLHRPVHIAQGGKSLPQSRGHVLQHRQNGSLHGLGHCPVSAGTAHFHGVGQDGHIGLTMPRKALGQAAEELGENDPGIPPRTEDGRAREALGQVGQVPLTMLNGTEAVFEGHDHIGSRVAVGDGEYVQIVDLGAVGLQVSEAVPQHIPIDGTVYVLQ